MLRRHETQTFPLIRKSCDYLGIDIILPSKIIDHDNYMSGPCPKLKVLKTTQFIFIRLQLLFTRYL